MVEILTTEQIVEKSKKWQSLLSDCDNVPKRDLFDLATDVVQIRASVGLVSLLELYQTAALPYEGIDLRLRTGSLTPKGQIPKEDVVYITLTLPDDKNPQKLTEAYHLVKKQDPMEFIDPLAYSRPIVSMRRAVVFRSFLDPQEMVVIRGENIYDDQPCTLQERVSVTKLAKTIWSSHLMHDAPFKAEYLPAEASA